jgi:hypothetical protein
MLLLNQRSGRSNAPKRPFLATPHPRRYIRTHNDNGTYESVRPICNRMLGIVRIEIILRTADRSELPGTNIRSGGKSTPVAEGTAAESPDMNTTPDACGGSVSSF